MCIRDSINTAGRSVSRFVQSIGNALTSTQHRFESFDTKRFRKLARPQPGHVQKRTPQRRLRRPQRLSQSSQANAFFTRLSEITCRSLYQRHRCRNLIRPATQASPITLLLGFFLSSKKRDVSPQRPPRRTRWPAINMRRAHRQHETPIGS